MIGGQDDYTGAFEVFYDGQCPLCIREINMLRKIDRNQLVIFTDIADPTFDSEAETGLSFDALMARIHGRLSDGTMIEGVEVFRQLYGRTFLKPLVPLTRIPGIRGMLDASYVCFAWLRYRSRGGPCQIDGECRIAAVPRTQDG